MSVSRPKVSVVMSVFNGETYLRAAIDSILNQTLRDFEFVIVDDGSTDSSVEIVKSYNDPRIRLRPQKNQGLAAALNNGVAVAQAEYIARMDQDDISHLGRLETEYRYLLENPDVGLVGTWICIIDDKGGVFAETKEPTTPREIRRRILTYNCFNHGSVMFLKSVFERAGGYGVEYPESTPVEDYGLWLRMLQICDGANIPQFLYFWRKHSTSISSIQKVDQRTQRILVSQKYIRLMIQNLENNRSRRKDLAQCYLGLATTYYQQRAMGECRRHLLRAISLDPLVSFDAYRYFAFSLIGKELRAWLRRRQG